MSGLSLSFSLKAYTMAAPSRRHDQENHSVRRFGSVFCCIQVTGWSRWWAPRVPSSSAPSAPRRARPRFYGDECNPVDVARRRSEKKTCAAVSFGTRAHFFLFDVNNADMQTVCRYDIRTCTYHPCSRRFCDTGVRDAPKVTTPPTFVIL